MQPMTDRRRHYRVRTHGSRLVATVQVKDAAYVGLVRDTSHGGVSVAFASVDSPVIAVGDVATLVLSGGGMTAERNLTAEVRGRRERVGYTEYGFRYIGGRESASTLDLDGDTFNRRAHRRYLAPMPVPVHVVLLDGPHRGQQFRGTIVDVSEGGMSFFLPADAEKLVSTTQRMSCTMMLPGHDHPETRDATIRNRATHERGVRYGCQWSNTPSDLPGPVYEPAWDCAKCGQTHLLATTHLHCPACGAPQTTDCRVYHPEWDGLQPRNRHPFTGRQHRCDTCGALHSERARFCGGCGNGLTPTDASWATQSSS